MSLEKTFWSTTLLVFLGLLIATVNQIICIPVEKLEKALDWFDYFLNKRNRKVTVLQVQKMCGTLNFISRCIIPGRAFTRRLYVMAGENLKSYHHVRVTAENRLDLQVWRKFLTDHIAFSRPFMDLCITSAEDLDMYSDATKSWKRGVGAYCKKEWVAAKWSKKFINECDPSIEFLELYGVVTAVLLWIKDYPNRRVCLFTDNQSVKNIVNNNSSGCKSCMVLIRLMVLECLIHNVRVFAKYVPTDENGKADALSRLDLDRFRRLDSNMNQ